MKSLETKESFKVSYYDFDSDSFLTKQCLRFNFNQLEDNLEFTPIDNPPKIYKSVVISHPIVEIFQEDGKISIDITGYQYTKTGGYQKMTTKIYNWI